MKRSSPSNISSISSKTIDSLEGYNGFRRIEDVSLDKLKPDTFLEIIKKGQDIEVENPVTINVAEVSDGRLSYYKGNKIISQSARRIKPKKYSMPLNESEYMVRILSNPSARGKNNRTSKNNRNVCII